MSFIFPGFNQTSVVEGNGDQDVYWRELGWCGFCSEKVRLSLFLSLCISKVRRKNALKRYRSDAAKS